MPTLVGVFLLAFGFIRRRPNKNRPSKKGLTFTQSFKDFMQVYIAKSLSNLKELLFHMQLSNESSIIFQICCRKCKGEQFEKSRHYSN